MEQAKYASQYNSMKKPDYNTKHSLTSHNGLVVFRNLPPFLQDSTETASVDVPLS